MNGGSGVTPGFLNTDVPGPVKTVGSDSSAQESTTYKVQRAQA